MAKHDHLTWTEWQPLESPGAFDVDSLAETLDGGQAFRWNESPDGVWTGIWGNCVCRLRLDSAGQLWESAPILLEKQVATSLPLYLGTVSGTQNLLDQLPWRSDNHLARCVSAFPHLRLLRQPFGEALLGFLCSATKQIVQIKQMCNNLAREFGEEIVPGVHALPTWEKLAETSEADLRACSLGFRARYIHATALLLAEDPTELERIPQLPYPEAKKALMRFPGIGEKVADCVLLFGAEKLEAFPVDTWIIRVMENRYGLQDWSNPQIAHFGRVHFGPLAGFAQQFLFAGERRGNLDRTPL